ncbi:hypothetical protein [Chitinivorax sp. B]|uniref:hypothetical protein n=1 Tax=Chitinivorax sp. B TaxID=2502235 RepID=UPI0010F66253|nr:hypothetical protein [Chitinivorax sp. B]
MNDTLTLINSFWQTIGFTQLIGYGVIGLLTGGGVSVYVVWSLHRRGWLARRIRLYHWALKLYFVLLPIGGAVFGLQAGLLVGMHQQINTTLDQYQPVLQKVANTYLTDFQVFLATLDQAQLKKQAPTIQGVMAIAVDQYLQQHPLPGLVPGADSTWYQRVGLKVLDQFRATLLSETLEKLLAQQAEKVTGVDEKAWRKVLKGPLLQLLDADFLLKLGKQQVSVVMRHFYLGIALQIALLATAIAAEMALAHYFRLQGNTSPAPAIAPPGPGMNR